MNKYPKSEFKKILFTEEDIAGKVAEMGRHISEDYEGKELTLIGILKGSYIVLSDLSRAISIPHTIDFMSVSSYEDTESTGVIKVLMDLRNSIKGRHVIVVEDILDSGLTFNAHSRYVKDKGACICKCGCFTSKANASQTACECRIFRI